MLSISSILVANLRVSSLFKLHSGVTQVECQLCTQWPSSTGLCERGRLKLKQNRNRNRNRNRSQIKNFDSYQIKPNELATAVSTGTNLIMSELAASAHSTKFKLTLAYHDIIIIGDSSQTYKVTVNLNLNGPAGVPCARCRPGPGHRHRSIAMCARREIELRL
jgi:hypothetical protein